MNGKDLGTGEPVPDEQQLAAALQELSAELELDPAVSGDLLDVAERTIEELRRLASANEELRQQVDQLQIEENPQNELDSRSLVTLDEDSHMSIAEDTSSSDRGTSTMETSDQQDVPQASIDQGENEADIDDNPIYQHNSPPHDK